MTDIEELSFRPASNVITDDEGPLRGETLFCDVPYLFERRPHDDANANEWGTWFDLTPIDLDAGLPIRAIGYFRRPDSVRWTSFGSPAVKNGPELRDQFCGFLRRLLNETATFAHWNAFVVAHYSDDVLEQVRIECVRLFLERDGIRDLSNSERGKLDSMIERLHEAVEP